MIKNLPYYLTCTLCPKKKEESLLRPPSLFQSCQSDQIYGLSDCTYHRVFFVSFLFCIVFVYFLESFDFFTIYKCPLCAFVTRSILSFC